MIEQVQWTSPSPLWNAAARVEELTLRRATLQRPTLLRFASDNFMDDFIDVMANDPARVTDFIARPETWRGVVAEKPVTAVTSVPALAQKLARLSLNAERQKRGITPLASNQVATLSSGVPSALQSVAAGNAAAAKPPPVLKLYPPAHQRYYLVTAHLVCGRTGLPDRAINAARAERVSFVMRRLLPPGEVNPNEPLPESNPATWEEYAFVLTGKTGSWQSIPAQPPQIATLVKGEEKLPLFAVNFTEDDGRKRRLFTGLVPVGRREAYMGASQSPPEDPPPQNAPKVADPRMMLVWSQVTEPWNRLLETADAARKRQGTNPLLTDPPEKPNEDVPLSGEALRQALKATREQIQTVSWYILLDFAKLLEQYLPNVWASLSRQLPSPPMSAAESALLDALGKTVIPANLITAISNASSPAPGTAGSLQAALTAMNGGSALDGRTRKEIEDGLEAITKSYDRANPDPRWPKFLFPLADSQFTGPLPPKAPNVANNPDPLLTASQRVANLADLIEKALRPAANEEMPETGLAGQPVFDTREGWFAIRCVFERPECGPLDPPLLSEPTRPFQLAGFFDPDAPARPIRIALPLDTSPAGLRKFDKNTAFMISDMLCGQIGRMKSLGLGDLIRTVLPWPLHKDLSVPDGGACLDKNDPSIQVGMICSMSIPIITICALLLLMIIVNLLDIIFRWVPYFLICFPLPGLKAKK